MATDPDAKDLTLNYPGGSLTMTIGALKSMFGTDYDLIVPVPEIKTVTVKSHSRVRVIGEPPTNVTGFTYEFTQWPTSQRNNAAAGKLAYFSWENSEGTWAGRVTGSFAELGTFLQSNVPTPTVFYSERGTDYGPYQKGL